MPVGHPYLGVTTGGGVTDGLLDGRAKVDAVGAGRDGAARPEQRHIGDAGEPEDPGGVTIAVVTDHVPAAAGGDHAPWFDGANGERVDGAGPVLELDRLLCVDGGEENSQYLFRAPQAGRPGTGGDGDSDGGVHVHAGGPEFEQRALGGRDALRGLPQRGRYRHRRRFVRGEVDIRQCIGVRCDAIALSRVEG